MSIRREFITQLGGAAAAWPLAAIAQRPAKIARVGIIDDAPIWDHFRQALREAGVRRGPFPAQSVRAWRAS